MAGISSIGVYVPRYRIEVAEINKAWGRGGGKGMKAVAAADEDALTMGIRAAQSALNNHSVKRNVIGAVYFASVSSGYAEYALASQAAEVLGLNENISIGDFGLTTRSVTSAIQAAVDAIDSARLEHVLVIASDVMIAEPGSSYELNYACGAGAILISSDGAVKIEQIESINNNFIGRSRQEGEWYGLVDDRFIMKHGFVDVLANVVQQLDVETSEYAHAVIQSPDFRWASRLSKTLKLNPEALQSSAPLIGYTGTASFLIDLALALEKAKTGARIMAVSYGPGGGDALSLNVREPLGQSQSISKSLMSENTVSYPEYLRMNKLLGGKS